MYRLGHRQAHHYALIGGGLVVGAAVLIGIAWLVTGTVLKPHTVIRQSPPLSHTVTATSKSLQQVSQGIISLSLPTTWQRVAAPQLPGTIYSWAGTEPPDAARRLDVYVDSAPTNFAVNRLLPVQAAGNQLDVTAATSDNCVNFTDKTSDSTATGRAASKWGGVNFLCDMGNYERDVVGTGSTEGLNQVTLVGPTSGRHRILLVYADNNTSPDYAIFVAIVKSFHLN